MTPERLAEILDRHDQGDSDTLELALDCLGNGINVLDHRTPSRNTWINDLKQYQADHDGLLAEVQRLTDELDSAGWSSDRSWSREIDLVQDRDEARTLARAFRTAHHDDQPDDELSLLLPDWLTEEPAS